MTNQVRASAGAPPLALDGALSAVATTWSATQALVGTISHNPALKTQTSRFSRVGENVGMGGSVESVHTALVASPGHYANIVNPNYSRVGLGVVQSGITVYVTQVFVQPSGAGGSQPAAGAAPPATTATTAPRPAARVPATTVTTARTPGRSGTGPATAAPAAAGGSSPARRVPRPGTCRPWPQLAAWDRLLP